MGKKGKKKARSGHKDKQVPVASLNTVSQDCISNTETASEGIVVVKEKRVCPHLDQGIDFGNVLTKIKSSDPLRCGDCRDGVVDRRAGKEKGKQGKKKGAGESKSESKAIWVCLQCGQFSCGGAGFPTTRQSHAVRHARQHRHPLAIQFENPQLRWCFLCSTIIPVEKSLDNSEQKDVLHDLSKLIKGRSSEGPKIDVEEIWFGSRSVTSGIKSETSVPIISGVNGSYTVRGLLNLGNTCFFNSVMQNLLAMDKLRDYFLKLDGSLGPLTASLKKLYVETIPEAGSKGVVNPRSFFGWVCAKAPQFRGYQQHDSHELLRCLLDALCTEELTARKQIKYSQEDEKSPQNDSTFVDLIFGGQLSSTVSCLECGHSSTVYEPFLDLSLPVPTKKPPSRKAQPVSRAKKQKPPPRRSGKNISKAKKDANIYPANRAADQITGGQSSLPVQSIPTFVNQSVGLSADSVSLNTSIATAPTDEMQLVSQNPIGAQDVGSKQGTEDSAWLDYLVPDVPLEDSDMDSEIAKVTGEQGSGTENTVLIDSLLQKPLGSSAQTALMCLDAAPCSDDMTWLDSCGPGTLSDHDGIASQTNVELTSLDTRTNDAAVSDVNKHSSESCNQVSFDDSNVVVDSSGKLWEDEIPMRVQDSAVILLPYKEDALVSEVFMGEEVSSSAVGCDPEEFGGLGDLFNEPEATTEPCTKPQTSSNSSETNAPAHTGILVGHSSESDPDEVDNSIAPVSVDSCLSYFVKPELLSKDEHAWQCENCSKEKVRMRKKMLKHSSDSVINGNGGSSSSTFFSVDENLPSSSGLENLCNGTTDKDVFNSNHDSEQPHSGETNDSNCVINMSEKAELEPIFSQLEHGKPEMEDAPQSSNSEESTCEKSNSNELNEPGSVDGDSHTVKQLGSNSLTVNSQSQESEDEEMDSKKVKVKRDATKRILINKPPPILTVHLKRFSQDARGRLSKLNGHVGFRDTINLKPYVNPRCIDRDRYKYRLLGVVEHSGTMRGGHYVAYVRGGQKGTQTSENGSHNFTWFHASDAYVRETTLEEVLRCEAYILFYEQI